MNKTASNLKNFITRLITNHKSDIIWLDILIFAIALIQHWQTRELLPKKQLAPEFTLYDIGGKKHSLAEYRGKPVLIYFFAPWCTVCKVTSSNLTYLRKLRSADKLVILAIGASYNDQSEIINFSKNHEFDNAQLSVLLDDTVTSERYKINAFPTFYFIDSNGMVTSTATGYTTTVGLFIRSL